MPANSSVNPAAVRLELALRLRQLRLQAGRSIEEAATELMCSPAKVSRMETGGRGVQARDVRDLCRFYGVSDRVRDELIGMSREAKRRGWWQDYRALDDLTLNYFALESAATAVTMLETRVIPGLLQTEDYTRALLSGLVIPAPDPEWIDEQIDIRKRRAERIEKGELVLSTVVDESVFYRTLGNTRILAHQIDFVIQRAALANVHLQIAPLDSPPHPGIYGSFSHLSFENLAVPDLVFFEALGGNSFQERESDVQRYLEAYEATRRQSWSPDQSLDWLAKIRKESGNKLLRSPVPEHIDPDQ
jgi:transcriptional regulator with XRE-family HTH domain